MKNNDEINETGKKERIFASAKKLFYQRGFSKTTIRQIANDSDTNVALPIYYFKSKDNLGVLIYNTVRREIREIALSIFPKPDEVLHMITMCFATDMYLLLKNGQFRDLYLAIAFSSALEEHTVAMVEECLKLITTDTSDAYMNGMLLPYIKAGLLKCDKKKYHLTDREIALFYVTKYLSSLHISEYLVHGIFENIWNIIQQLNIEVTDEYTLVYDREFLAAQSQSKGRDI